MTSGIRQRFLVEVEVSSEDEAKRLKAAIKRELPEHEVFAVCEDDGANGLDSYELTD
jgi:hypothetical protein